jgi:hypothetical protein
MNDRTTHAQAQMLAQLGGPDQYGVLLVAQVGGTPNELQFIVETARYDAAAGGLRPQGDYIVRALGVFEHRVHLGVFEAMAFHSEHPLLLWYNTPRTAVQFAGKPADVHELVLDIYQAYVSTFGPWRNVAEIGRILNTQMPLVDLLMSGAGLLGTMPKPLAERMLRVLAHHQIGGSLAEAPFEAADEHGRSRLAKALIMDSSAVVALDFSVEAMGSGRG